MERKGIFGVGEEKQAGSPSAGGRNGGFALRVGRMADSAGGGGTRRGGICPNTESVRCATGEGGALPRVGRRSTHGTDTGDYASSVKNRKRDKRRRAYSTAEAVALVCAIICAVSLTAFSLSDRDSTSSDYVPAAITFTPPEQLEPKGFWDYLAEAVAKLFGSVGQ